MEKQKVKILDIFPITHDTKCFRTEKPDGMSFEPGQATEIFLDDDDWKDEGRPFTFTNSPDDTCLEFIIKEYPEHDGVTEQLHKLTRSDSLILDSVFGAIKYKGEGLFIAGGAGITPFISILRSLHKSDSIGKNRLIFGNKTSDDIILYDEFKEMLGEQMTNVLSEEKTEETRSGFITREMIVDHLKINHSKIYVCGPPPMMDAVLEHLTELEIAEDAIIKEEF